ncbi:unnamed protein product [Oikopleura dioica]|uniref:Peptidase S1 domain-containing protein n=1 Tax=Oikopleura dioica TaxID=34765 RepID=E4X1I8_OIKDI|nr:unnamed protein product [Oikopleura dioica]
MNRCFHQSNITDYDLRAGKLTVVGKFLDFATRKVQYRTISLVVPIGSTIRTLNVVDLFQQYCDVTNEISAVDGLSDNEDSDASGEEILLEHDDALSHDQRVYTRRHLLNRMLKWITMTSTELLECYSFTAAYNIVCTGPQKKGQKTKITCTGSEPSSTYWTAPKGPKNWRSVCEEEEIPENPDFLTLTGHIAPGLLTCTQEENKLVNSSNDNRLSNSQEGRIVGGVEAGDNSWPWMVRLQLFDKHGMTTSCGGSVIANRWVLSAAHCCEGQKRITAFFGDVKKNENDSFEFELEATKWIKHWEFGKSADGSASNSDLCLIKFEEDILKTDPEGKVGAACLPNKQEEHGAACWVAGWGSVKHGGRSSNELLSVGVNILDHQYCMENSKFQEIGMTSLLPDDICASKPDLDGDGFTEAGADACQGDSGGPLICPVDGKAVIVGVVSRGYGCAWKGYPGIYTSAFKLRLWIRKFIAKYGV